MDKPGWCERMILPREITLNERCIPNLRYYVRRHHIQLRRQGIHFIRRIAKDGRHGSLVLEEEGRKRILRFIKVRRVRRGGVDRSDTARFNIRGVSRPAHDRDAILSN